MGRNNKQRRAAKKKERTSTSGLVTQVDHADGSRSVVFRGWVADELGHSQDALAEEFRAKFGRDPRADEPLIFDPDAEEPSPLSPVDVERKMVDLLTRAGLPAEYLYAYQQTGILLTEENMPLFNEADLEEWQAAIDRYHDLHDE